jgi:hypothetical protein
MRILFDTGGWRQVVLQWQAAASVPSGARSEFITSCNLSSCHMSYPEVGRSIIQEVGYEKAVVASRIEIARN